LVGHTTDGIGAVSALRHNGANPTGKEIVLLGAGGASRSVSFTLAEEARELIILNRTVEKAETLTEDLADFLGDDSKVRAAELNNDNLKKELRDADILVNATSVGMYPESRETLVDRTLLRPDLVVFDLVYEPVETRLLREAREMGARTVDGPIMLVHQGAASFEIWTGVRAPIEVMTEAAMKELQKPAR
jgi:shikimate dehydrogenase